MTTVSESLVWNRKAWFGQIFWILMAYYFEGDVVLLGNNMQVTLEMPVIYLLSFGVSLF
jgi:hypothetical protein